MLLEWAMTPEKVRCKVPCRSASRNSRPARSRMLGTVTWVRGVATPSWIAAAAVMTLAVDPGSKTSENARLPR